MSLDKPSMYEILLMNFSGEIDLHRVAENDQIALSVLDNMQRILNSREGALTHLQTYGLPDMSEILQGLPGTAHRLMQILRACLLKHEPRVANVAVQLLTQREPGYLDYALQVEMKDGERATFATLAQPQGKLVLRHLRQHYRARTP
ncbi:type VI secretion system baseplate subunit TssE [Pseudomonas sp. dw_358]|uniref:type VI secretion system baseplate subunit TssE n=1 Tax=Pseudomonas sp. dw_358 TaxID=2720083 RepID=UPI001BD4759D|nr:type VI secretion system baseplate subunit TssE [Pseudomonas sp. dw_358]